MLSREQRAFDEWREAEMVDTGTTAAAGFRCRPDRLPLMEGGSIHARRSVANGLRCSCMLPPVVHNALANHSTIATATKAASRMRSSWSVMAAAPAPSGRATGERYARP